MVKIIGLAILLSVWTFQAAVAEIFKWVDEKGTTHFTEDPATIPEKYREKVLRRTTEEDLMSPEERARARRQHEQEVRERLMREKKEIGEKELEKRVKEIMEQRKGECEIISYSQYDVITDVRGGGDFVSARKSTCVDLIIRNNAREPKMITEQNIIAITSKPVGNKKLSSFNPKRVSIQLLPGEVYRGSICFDRQFRISKLELQGL